MPNFSFYHPALPCHSMLLGKNYSTLIHSLDRGLVLYIYIYFIYFKNLFYHPSLLYQSMLLGGGGCCMPNFSFIILHCPVIPYYEEKAFLPLFTPLGGD